MIQKMIEIFYELSAMQSFGLKSIGNFLQIVFTSLASSLEDRIDNCYTVFTQNEFEPISVSQDDETDAAGTVNGIRKIVNFWCFSPAFG